LGWNVAAVPYLPGGTGTARPLRHVI